MNRRTISGLLLLLLAACTEEKKGPSADSDVDAVSSFIRASLDNDFASARNYLLADSANLELLELAAENRARLSREENRRYKEASIRIHDTRSINDSTSIIIYDNSFRHQRDSMRVVRQGDQWRVDLKYTLLNSSGNQP